MAKITVVGAGNVGATCANVLAFNEVADEIVLLDIKEGVSEGKALDMMQTATLLGFDTKINGVTMITPKLPARTSLSLPRVFPANLA